MQGDAAALVLDDAHIKLLGDLLDQGIARVDDIGTGTLDDLSIQGGDLGERVIERAGAIGELALEMIAL